MWFCYACLTFSFLHESSINVSVVIQLTHFCVIQWAKFGIKNFKLQLKRYTADGTLQEFQGLSDQCFWWEKEGERREPVRHMILWKGCNCVPLRHIEF